MAASLILAACTAGHGSKPDVPDDLAAKVRTRIKPLVESLYLNTKELKETYRDLRSVAQAHALRGEDRQLNYIQKSALYIQKSHQSAFHQWEMLSIMEDIRATAVVDYFTLRHKGLQGAEHESVYDRRFITIYQSRIENAAARHDIDKALGIIEANGDIFVQLLKAIEPVVRRGRTPKRL